MRRRKRVINWGAIFAVFALVNLIFASFRSPLTAIRRINLSGVRQSERLRLERIQQLVQGVPAMQLDPGSVEQMFLGQSRVKSCTFSRNIFGSGRLEITYRKAVADAGNGALLDADGEFFSDPEQGENLVKLKLAPILKVTSATVMGVTDFRQIAEACAITQGNFPEGSVSVLETGVIRLDIEGGHVILGSPGNLSKKFDTLIGLLRDRPTLLKGIEYLNLTNPDRATVSTNKNDKPVQPNP